jgi:flagellar biosynthesis GTPase FlhF
VTETKTYRGKTLDEVLPQIRAELGDDAIILRRREGIVGGIGGFFGRRCVEVDAIPSPAAATRTVALPTRTVFDAYDSHHDDASDAGDDAENPVIRTMLDQALVPGAHVQLSFPPEHCMYFDASGHRLAA